jgi:excisionase family DNA binding protein
VKTYPDRTTSTRLSHPSDGSRQRDRPTQLELIPAVPAPLDDANPRGGVDARHKPDPMANRPSRLSSDRLTMTVSEAAAVLGISRALAYELVARDEIPAIRLGHRIVVPTKRLEDFVLGGGGTSGVPRT